MRNLAAALLPVYGEKVAEGRMRGKADTSIPVAGPLTPNPLPASGEREQNYFRGFAKGCVDDNPPSTGNAWPLT